MTALSACDSTQQLSAQGMHAYELSVAASGNTLAAAWHGGVRKPDAIYLQWLNDQGQPDGPPQRISDSRRDAYEADLQFINGDALLVWYEKNLRDGALTASMARVRRSGDVLWRRSLGDQGAQARNPVVRVVQQMIYVAWIETSTDQAFSGNASVWAARIDAQGNNVSTPRRVGDASEKTWNLNAAVDANHIFYVVYDAQLNTRAKELQLLMIDDQQVRHLSLSADDGYDSSYPDLGISDNGNVAITWFDERDGNREVYLGTGSLVQLQAGDALSTQRITNTTTASIGAYLAWNGERLALVWCDDPAKSKQLYAQFFDVHGAAVSKVQRLTHTTTKASIPAIRPWRQGFVVTWNEYQAAIGEGHSPVESSIAKLRWLQ